MAIKVIPSYLSIIYIYPFSFPSFYLSEKNKNRKKDKRKERYKERKTEIGKKDRNRKDRNRKDRNRKERYLEIGQKLRYIDIITWNTFYND